ncbi:PAS domain S-box protein [Hydrogenophaga sp.]|uniref:PAS domain-containing hybrid sensor histidine kinase/response regulator n=2 Tax=Hydrogenophaga sp. TaxID=1904254 RepID=UPI00271B6026|nr:PAS domain S-box protein [Hydrogenophaga sp.]MDO9133613.1 PAS domain S-box protein [Hydrogenophaga sp.]
MEKSSDAEPTSAAERALRISERRYRRLFEAAFDGILLLNAETAQIEDVNPYLVKLLGYSREEFLGKKVWELGAFKDTALSKQAFAELQEDHFIRYEDLPLETKDGRRIAVEFVSNVYLVEDLRVIQCNIRDITLRKQAENDLLEANNRLQSIVGSAMDAIITVDEAQDILVFNEAASAMFGCPAANAIGEPIDRFFPLRHRSGEAEKLIDIDDSFDASHAVNRLRQVSGLRANGHEFPAEASISSTRVQGRQLYTAIVRDVSLRVAAELAQKNLEGQIRQAQKMEALGTLSGGIAHDFNNILGVIIGNVTLAQEEVDHASAAQVSLTEIAKAAKRARSLVDQILTFSRNEVQELVDQPLLPLLEEARRLLRATLPAAVHFEGRFATVPIYARVDASQILQLLINLVTNAWHALRSEAGKISVELDEVKLFKPEAQRCGGLSAGRYARIRVSDDGQGMDAATQMRVFEPFFTTKPRGSGTGLGLAVVHGIVKSHRGGITLKSAPGEGCVFEVYLPAVPAPFSDSAKAIEQPVEVIGHGKHVLYLDDDESMVFLMERLLRTRGFRVSAFEIAEEALKAVRADPTDFDLIVSDFNMPNGSGLEVALAMRKIRSDLPVVIISGFVTDELLEGALAAGVQEVVYKPNSVSELVDSIGRLLHA